MIRDPKALDALISGVHDWVRSTAHPAEDLVDERDEVPAEIVADMAERGYFGWSIPEEYGGLGLTTEELVMGAMELSQCAVAFRARVGTNTGIGSEALVADGTDWQKRTYLPLLAKGEMTGSFALTEPEAGSDASALTTSARRDGDDYILDGMKCYITNAPIADLFTVMARTAPDTPGARGVSAFLVERTMPGLTTSAGYKMMGQRGSPVGEVHLDGVRVPARNLIGGEEGQGFRTAMKVLNKQRIHLAALCTGPAIRMLDMAMHHAESRHQSGRAIADFQLVAALLADCRTDIEAARALVLQTARARDQGRDIALEASICKYFASEACGRVADRCVQVFGGAGYVANHSSIERYYRDIRLFRLYEGTSQIHQLNIMKQMRRARA
ncbi:acyl-CoA dehydrogenase [Pseudooceanicola sediminis]|uniref:Acyl-CoA dehydrogenase n=1 Tax=Pseudooceanicola sediminis TaxID=2211117 RepID=A0A399J380_9RHOB|nr:acyl-CoA dehydrogenase family protein [Pseudooceanicola sediminis]KAA2315104.1 acyl-CoA dehydrogenase [Puniceibacterium sp. HSS470]RII38919.1 acyl-CoA dehydrogenase [Pseudooceanicola sediminis]|tara:strand:+ start:53597 stop:54751 length:1155 start_codon:yes stop_codon:yes gene_type:complete